MAGKLQYIKQLSAEICGYWPEQAVVSNIYALTGIDADTRFNTGNIKASTLLRPTRLEGVKKGYLAASFGVVAPVCQSCRACVPLRVNTDKFTLSPSQEKMLARGNFTYGFTASVLLNPQELYNLFKKYTAERHNEKTSKMHDWSMDQFRNWLDFMPFAMTARDPDNFLRGFAAMEADKDSALLEYIVFDPELKKLSMGKRLWLQAMVDAQSSGIKHVYVGAWAKDSPKLDYKKHHSGLETFDGREWLDFDPAVHTRGPNYRAMLKDEGFTL